LTFVFASFYKKKSFIGKEETPEPLSKTKLISFFDFSR
jgi:hypothetical protein